MAAWEGARDTALVEVEDGKPRDRETGGDDARFERASIELPVVRRQLMTAIERIERNQRIETPARHQDASNFSQPL